MNDKYDIPLGLRSTKLTGGGLGLDSNIENIGDFNFMIDDTIQKHVFGIGGGNIIKQNNKSKSMKKMNFNKIKHNKQKSHKFKN
jgi:hypothetical protein